MTALFGRWGEAATLLPLVIVNKTCQHQHWGSRGQIMWPIVGTSHNHFCFSNFGSLYLKHILTHFHKSVLCDLWLCDQKPLWRTEDVICERPRDTAKLMFSDSYPRLSQHYEWRIRSSGCAIARYSRHPGSGEEWCKHDQTFHLLMRASVKTSPEYSTTQHNSAT